MPVRTRTRNLRDGASVPFCASKLAPTFCSDFDTSVRLEARDGQSGASLMQLSLEGSGGHRDYIDFSYDAGNGWHMVEGAQTDTGTVYTGTGFVPLRMGEWSHVTITLTRGVNDSKVTLVVDGAPTSTSKILSHQYPSTPKLTVGITAIKSATADWRVRYDNVVANLN